MAASKDVSLPYSHLDGPLIVGGHRNTHTLIDPFSRTKKKYFCPEMEGISKSSIGCFENHLFLWDYNTRECFFLDLTSMSKIALPLMPLPLCATFCNLSVSSSLSCPDCVVICTKPRYRSLDLLFFCHLSDEKWTEIQVPLPDGDFFAGTNDVHQGRLYVQTSNGVVVFDVSSLIRGGNIEMKMIKGPEIPKYPKKGTPLLNMVESLGDIFMVRVYLRNRLVVYIDIHRLDISTTDNWKRVESIEDRAFFLEDNGSFSVRAKDVGVQSNCIYSLTRIYGGSLYKFCLDDRTFNFGVVGGYCINISWILPLRHERIIESISKLPHLGLNKKLTQILEDVEEETKANVHGSWADLPTDLFQLILPDLSLIDVVRFLAVCKAWKSIPDPFRKVEIWPWLMYNAKADGTYKFFDPLHGKQYTTKIKSLSLGDRNDRVLLLGSKNGWIMALIDDRMVVMVNPFFPDNTISSPTLLDLYNFAGITFSSVPNCPDCVVFGISNNSMGDFAEIYLWQLGLMNEKWEKITLSTSKFEAENANPVFMNGDFYCLGTGGKLGVFNLKTKTWKILRDKRRLFLTYEDCNLLEYEGELICTFQRHNIDAGIRILKWNHTKMTWDHMLNRRGSLTVFLGTKSSLVRSLSHINCNDKIFTPVFYSHVLSNERNINNLESYNIKRPIDCVWLEPNMHK